VRPAEDQPPDFGDAFRAHDPGLLAFVRRRVPPFAAAVGAKSTGQIDPDDGR
jgi:hypothetical protein